MKPKSVIIVTAILLLFPALGPAFTVKTTSGGQVVQWSGENAAIFYAVASEGPASLPETLTALSSAFAGWERKAPGAIKFIFSGREENIEFGKDGKNALIWTVDEWSYDPGVVAMSTVWFSDATGEIEEVDIEFNGRDYRWSVDGAGDTLAIRNVALHEIGHLLGVDHAFAPGSVMHSAVTAGDVARKELNNDDSEALRFIYPPGELSFLLLDLPVLFYPRDFPGENGSRELSAPPPASNRWVVALGSADADGDGYWSEVVAAYLDLEGGYSLKVGTYFQEAGKGRWAILAPPRELEPAGDIIALSGVDLDRDGLCNEVAVLSRAEEKEMVGYYDPLAGPSGRLASQALDAPPANNVIGMSCLDLNGDGFRDELAVLRAEDGGYNLSLYSSPNPGEDGKLSQRGTVLRLPGLHPGSKLLGLAEVDADGSGEGGDLVVLEKTEDDGFWLHAFAFIPSDGDAGPDLRYLTSTRAPDAKGKILPRHLTGVDSNRDGFYNELLILSEK